MKTATTKPARTFTRIDSSARMPEYSKTQAVHLARAMVHTNLLNLTEHLRNSGNEGSPQILQQILNHDAMILALRKVGNDLESQQPVSQPIKEPAHAGILAAAVTGVLAFGFGLLIARRP